MILILPLFSMKSDTEEQANRNKIELEGRRSTRVLSLLRLSGD